MNAMNASSDITNPNELLIGSVKRAVVVNVDDPQLAESLIEWPQSIPISVSEQHSAILNAHQLGGRAVFARNGHVVLAEGASEWRCGSEIAGDLMGLAIAATLWSLDVLEMTQQPSVVAVSPRQRRRIRSTNGSPVVF
jgi:hypothetical protein